MSAAVRNGDTALPPRFATRLTAAVTARHTPSCIGLDPRLESLPPAATLNTDPGDPRSIADAFRSFCRDVIDVVAPLVPVVKPQVACFEAIGPHGMLVLADVIAHARSRGLLVLADGKRGDIGSTAEAYAAGWLGGPWAADALTVNPYLGLDSIEPFVAAAEARHAGLFVLVKTSNPGSRDFQDLASSGRSIYEHVAAGVEQLAARSAAGGTYGDVGAVVGATWPRQLDELRAAMPHTWILVPGFGRQGGRAADVRGAFHADGLGALVVSARDVIFAHARPEMNTGLADAQWQRAVERACRDMIDRLADDTPAAALRD
ncbi:MAG: orotidine-5'-phosphate decarboxylase [Planctomycetia bacterium]|nr:orotidine-5'-phosphate decarboxylase [Planctomycetia bacterium]